MICEHLFNPNRNGNVKLLSYEINEPTNNGWLKFKLIRNQQLVFGQYQDLDLDNEPSHLTARHSTKDDQIYLANNKSMIFTLKDKVGDLEQLVKEQEQSNENTSIFSLGFREREQTLSHK